MIEGEFLRGSHDFLLSKQRSKIVMKENDIVIMNYNEAEIPILWSPDAKSWLIWKDPDAGKDWGQEEKGTTEDELDGITNSQSLLKLMSIESVMPSNHLILCFPLLFLPSVFPSIRVFPNESVIRIR